MKKKGRILKKEIVRVVFPTTVSVLLFAIAIFMFAIPLIKEGLLDQKKKMIIAEVQTAFSILKNIYQKQKLGKLSIDDAQRDAKNIIRELKYGTNNKDYFWINNLKTELVMHPYNKELEGKDLSTFKDVKGNLLFIRFVEIAKTKNAGFVQYFWQWKDDKTRIEPKLSYVKLFKPWGWILGTGVYIDDVNDEIARLTKKLLYIYIGILFIIIILSIYIIRNNLKDILEKQIAEDKLIKYQESLEHIVDKRTKDLQEALSKVKTLSGFLPICSSCKKIRDDNGYWNQIESYITNHSDADFSHSICPDCIKELYPDFKNKDSNNK